MGMCLKIVNANAYKQQACQHRSGGIRAKRDGNTTERKTRAGTGFVSLEGAVRAAVRPAGRGDNAKTLAVIPWDKKQQPAGPEAGGRRD
jgi:hypothetical protein